MDYEEEQKGELEVLESIYEGELTVLSESAPRCFTIPVRSEKLNEEEDEEGLFVLLKFTHTDKYPEEAPAVEVEERGDNVEDDVLREFLAFVDEQIAENLGMVLVFTVVSAAIEWMGSKNEQLKERRLEEARAQKEREEEAERKRFEGTRVTIENFLAWKRKFDDDKAKERAAIAEKAKAELAGKLTGRQLFMQDKSLNDSDVKFLEAAGETVKVDESLFEDLDDLDLDDDEDEDPDWNPGGED